MTGPAVIVKSGRHRAQSITLIENAEAVIIQKSEIFRMTLMQLEICFLGFKET